MAHNGGLVFTLRKHRKKSIFFSGLLCYGFHYGAQRYREYLIRREYFIEAKKYGEEFISPLDKPRRLYVILNPTASNGKCKTLFQKNAAPILNLAGIDVTFIQTDYEGHAKTTVNYFDPTVDGVVVAGGDGVLQEVVTGMFRQREEENIGALPVGFIPLGANSNSVYRRLFSSDAYRVRSMCKATMAIVKGHSKEMDIMEIETGQKPIFALSNIHYGVHQQVKEKIDAGKYWLLGPLKKYFAFIWRTARNWPPAFNISLSCPPDNNQEGQTKEMTTDNFSLYLHKESDADKSPRLIVQRIENDQPRNDFIKFGWEWMKNDFEYTPRENSEIMNCTEVSINPTDEDTSYDIDGEHYDARPITVRVHPRKLNIFCYPDS